MARSRNPAGGWLRWSALAAGAVFFIGLPGSSANAQTRRAFIVGIEKYSDRDIQALKRPVNDANDLAKDLENTGFERKNIKVVTNLKTREGFEKEFGAFLKTIEGGDTVLFYFSGHGFGIESDKANYLLMGDLKSPFAFTRGKMPEKERKNADVIRLRIPANLEEYERTEIPKNGVSVAEIERRLADKDPGAVIMMLDACRTVYSVDPEGSGDATRLRRGREIGSRLVSPPVPPEKPGLVLYSASFGEQAAEALDSDDRRRNSLFTEVLRSELQRPGQTLVQLAERVKLMVRSIAQQYGHQQDPEYAYNPGDGPGFLFIGSIGHERFPANQDKCRGATEDWNEIKARGSREDIERHRRRFDGCMTAELARGALNSIQLSTEDPVDLPAAASNRPVNPCDRLAASEFDPTRPPEVPGVPFLWINSDEAIRACREAVEQNPRIVRYQFNLGQAYQRKAMGLNAEDPERAPLLVKARVAYEDAQKRGYVSALNNLAVLYESEEGLDPEEGAVEQKKAANKKEAYTLLRRAAQQGHPLAMYNLALRYQKGIGVRRDLTQAYEWFAKSAEAGYVSAMIEFGDALRTGNGLCLNNPKRAVEWYQRAADIGANRAKLKLYEIYDRGERQRVKTQFTECRQAKANESNNVRPDSTLALLWLGRVAQTANIAAQAYLAEKMEEGYGMPASQPAIAERYWRRAAYAGSAYAEVELAERLRNGVILVKEEYGNDEVISLLERAKSQGSPRAALYLGQIYRNGEFGQEKDPHKAMQLAYEAIDLAMQADPSTSDGNPFYEIAAGHLLVEMSKSGEIHPTDALSAHEIERLTRFYGVVDPDTNRVKIRRLSVPLGCYVFKDRKGNEVSRFTRRAWVWVWDWGREESPTELQFRNLERSTRCYHNELYRATLIEVFKDAKKNRVRFADLIQQRIRTAQAAQAAVSEPEPQRERRRGRRGRR